MFSLLKPAPLVAVIGFVGLLILFITPPFQSPDEQTHFYRAYQISQGDVFASKLSYGVGGNLPKSLSDSFNAYSYIMFNSKIDLNKQQHANASRADLDPNNTVETRFENTAIYPPLVYFPQVIGMWIGNIFSAGPVQLLYLARVFNLFFWLIALYVIFRRNSKLVLPFAAFASIPIVAFQTASASADVITITMSALFISEIFRVLVANDFARKQKIILIILALLLGLCKSPYVLLVLCVLLIPSEKFATARSALVYKSGLIAAGFLSFLVWLLASKDTYINMREIAHPSAQIEYLIHAPYGYVKTLFETFILSPNSDGILLQMVGHLGWIDTKMPLWAIFISITTLLLAALTVNLNKKILSGRQLIFLGFICVFVINVIAFILYVTWNAPGAKVIDGVQGRYLIPLYPLAIIMLASRKWLTQRQINGITPFIAAGILVVSATTIISLMYRYHF